MTTFALVSLGLLIGGLSLFRTRMFLAWSDRWWGLRGPVTSKELDHVTVTRIVVARAMGALLSMAALVVAIQAVLSARG